MRVFNFAIWWLQKISRAFKFVISVKIRKEVSLNNNFSIVDPCNCYQICYRNYNFITVSRDMRYTGINTILWWMIKKKKITKLSRYSVSWVLISRFFGFETFRRYKISQKWSNIAKFSTQLCFSMVYSGLNVIFSRKYTVFLSTFQNVLFYYQDIKLTLKKT